MGPRACQYTLLKAVCHPCSPAATTLVHGVMQATLLLWCKLGLLQPLCGHDGISQPAAAVLAETAATG